MVSVVMLSGPFPMALKAKQRTCSSSSTVSRPVPHPPQVHGCLHPSSQRTTSVSFIMSSLALSHRKKYIPQKERLKVKYKREQISFRPLSAHKGIVGINGLAMLRGKELCHTTPCWTRQWGRIQYG